MSDEIKIETVATDVRWPARATVSTGIAPAVGDEPGDPPPDPPRLEHDDREASTLAERVWNSPATRIGAYIGLASICYSVVITVVSAILSRVTTVGGVTQTIWETLCEATGALLAFWLMVRFAERRKMADVGFTLRGVVTETVAGYMIGLGVISACIGILAVLGAYRATGINLHFHFALPLLACLFAAVTEETLFRGIVFRLIEYRRGSFVAIVISSVIFGLLHLLNETNSSVPLAHKVVGPVFIAFEAGLLLSAAYMATRRLWLPIGIHCAWNYFEGPVYGTSVSGTDAFGPSLIQANLAGRFLLTGGSFGPEASVICLILCTCAGIALLRVAVRAGQWKPPGEWQPPSLPRVEHSR